MNMMPTMPPQNQEKPAIKHFIDPERYLGVSKETLDINALNPNYPQKVISNEEDVETWLNSIAFHRFMRFIIKCNYSVRNLKISDVKKMTNESKRSKVSLDYPSFGLTDYDLLTLRFWIA